MVIDSSALVAILLGEPELEQFNSLIDADSVRLVSAASLLEASIVLESRKDVPVFMPLDDFIRSARCVIMPVTEEQVGIGRNAYRIYGKGRHPAGLNFGDCFSYALAKVTGEPLLFKGSDFALTDVTPAAPPH